MDELEEYETGQIYFRDKWQFELKSDLPYLAEERNAFVQEFYFFIPNSLQVNDQTYTKTQFYLDQTNLIRFKTPKFTLATLMDMTIEDSPLARLNKISLLPPTPENEEALKTESRLLGNVVHSALRERMGAFLNELDHFTEPDLINKFADQFSSFCNDVDLFRHTYRKLQQKIMTDWPSKSLYSLLNYVDEFISNSINDYFSGFLTHLREKAPKDLPQIDQRICDIILKERAYREHTFGATATSSDNPHHDEYLLYRRGLLNKFIIDPLLLKTSRSSVDQRYRTIITGLPAAIAMLLYMLLFVWQGSYFLYNTEPFILLTVVIYVLKDRLKEELRFISLRQASRWFSDYTTEICTPDDKVVGLFKETFAFIDTERIPSEVMELRDRHIHSILEDVKRPERVLYYKKNVDIHSKPKGRFYGLNIIFRFDIHHFLNKAEDPYQTYLRLDPNTLKLQRIQLPKVYHINIIVRTHISLANEEQVEMKKYRLVVDKVGICRIERV